MPNLHLFASVGNNADSVASMAETCPQKPGSTILYARPLDTWQLCRRETGAPQPPPHTAAGEKSESENALAADFNSRTRDGDGRTDADGRVRGGGVSVSLRQKREVCRSLLKQSQPPTARSSAVSPESDTLKCSQYIITL